MKIRVKDLRALIRESIAADSMNVGEMWTDVQYLANYQIDWDKKDFEQICQEKIDALVSRLGIEMHPNIKLVNRFKEFLLDLRLMNRRLSRAKFGSNPNNDDVEELQDKQKKIEKITFDIFKRLVDELKTDKQEENFPVTVLIVHPPDMKTSELFFSDQSPQIAAEYANNSLDTGGRTADDAVIHEDDSITVGDVTAYDAGTSIKQIVNVLTATYKMSHKNAEKAVKDLFDDIETGKSFESIKTSHKPKKEKSREQSFETFAKLPKFSRNDNSQFIKLLSKHDDVVRYTPASPIEKTELDMFYKLQYDPKEYGFSMPIKEFEKQYVPAPMSKRGFEDLMASVKRYKLTGYS